jgi:hypothetical protein
MTRITTFCLITAATLLSGVAAARAADVTVQIAGHSPSQVQHDVVVAAQKACADAIDHDAFGEYGTQESCVSATVQATLRRIAAIDPAYLLAQAETAPAR